MEKDPIRGFYAAIGEPHHNVFSLTNLFGQLDPGETATYYITHPTNQQKLLIYAGFVMNDGVYYTNEIACTNMDTDADNFDYGRWRTWNDYCPDIRLTVNGEVTGLFEDVGRPQDLTSTEAYTGPENLLADAEATPTPTVKPTPKMEKPKPTATPTVVVRVEKQSMIPVWVWVVLALSLALALGLVVVFRKELKEKINRKPNEDRSHIENK